MERAGSGRVGAAGEDVMKIVIGVDDSRHSRAALDYVKRSNWPAGTKVIVVTAVQPVYAAVEMGGGAYVQAAQDYEISRHQELAARVESEFRSAGFDVGTRVVHGDAREALVDTVRGEGADLLVVGSHGRTGLDKLVMGSVASHVVTHAPCNVLVIKLPKR